MNKLVIFIVLSFALHAFAQPPCGKNGPSEWLNNPITQTITTGIGAPLSIDVSAFPQYYRFIGAQKFSGVYGCTPSTIKYGNDSTKLTYGPNELVASTKPSNTLIFSNLQVTYRDCTPAGAPTFTSTNSYYYQPVSGPVIAEYVQVSSSYPDGEKFTFEYDDFCRVISISESHNDELVSTTTFGYNTTSSFFAHLPSTVKTATSNGESFQKFEYFNSIRNVNRRLVTHFKSTLTTGPNSPSIVEEWFMSYNSNFRLINTSVTSSSRAGTSTFQYDFEYDTLGRWNAIYSFNKQYPEYRTLSISAKYPTNGSGRITDLQFQGPDSHFTLQYK